MSVPLFCLKMDTSNVFSFKGTFSEAI